jgi:hypothetical protein
MGGQFLQSHEKAVPNFTFFDCFPSADDLKPQSTVTAFNSLKRVHPPKLLLEQIEWGYIFSAYKNRRSSKEPKKWYGTEAVEQKKPKK